MLVLLLVLVALLRRDVPCSSSDALIEAFLLLLLLSSLSFFSFGFLFFLFFSCVLISHFIFGCVSFSRGGGGGGGILLLDAGWRLERKDGVEEGERGGWWWSCFVGSQVV